MYNKITDPITGRTFDINSIQGKNLIKGYKKYLKQVGGTIIVLDKITEIMTNDTIQGNTGLVVIYPESGITFEASTLILYPQTITINTMKTKIGMGTDPHNPFIYGVRIEAGLVGEDRDATHATHAILLKNFNCSHHIDSDSSLNEIHCITFDSIIEFVINATVGVGRARGKEFSVATKCGAVEISICLLGSEEMTKRNIPTIKIVSDPLIPASTWRNLPLWIKTLYSLAKIPKLNPTEKIYRATNKFYLGPDNTKKTDYIICRNNTPGFEGDRRLLILYNVENFHENNGIRLTSIRDIRRLHLPLLQHSIHNVIEVISSGEAHPTFTNFLEYKCYFHYEPSVYLLHLHVVHQTCSDTDSELGKTFLLSDVIKNIQLKDDYYASNLVALDRDRTEGQDAITIWNQIFEVPEEVEVARIEERAEPAGRWARAVRAEPERRAEPGRENTWSRGQTVGKRAPREDRW